MWPFGPALVALGVAGGIIALAGTRLVVLTDRLADRTGLGEAVMGGVFLGAVTSLPGITASVSAAAQGFPRLALANALGGIAAQTAFLAIADLAYRKANLEHAAASVPNMLWGALLIALLAGLLVLMVGPDVDFAGIHPMTPLLFLAYLLGARLVRRAREEPMWMPRVTDATAPDVPARESFAGGGASAWVGLLMAAILVIAAGWVSTRAGIAIVARSSLSETAVGALVLALVTSLPELVTSVAAVRHGALTLAVGNVLGGNAFDTLFAAAADVAYRDGSLYHAAGPPELALAAVTILMTAVLLLGMLRRERSGLGNIGFESVTVLVVYAVTVVMVLGRSG
ncbi:MAG: sodium:calcium antiporter [bacterium]